MIVAFAFYVIITKNKTMKASEIQSPIVSAEISYKDLNVPEEFRIEDETLNEKIRQKFNDVFISLLKKIAYEISVVGLTEEEACLICDYDYGKFTALKQNEPLVSQMFEKKNIEYKRSLLKPLSEKAKTDDKMAQWLLQARFPDDFNKKDKGSDNQDLLGAAISWIQKNNEGGIISETSGKAFVVKKMSDNLNLKNEGLKIHDILK